MKALGAALFLSGLAVTPASAQAAADTATVAYVKSPSGAFDRSGVMRFPAIPRVGDEIRAGPSEYRVVRILFVMAGESVGETRLYVERLGPAGKE